MAIIIGKIKCLFCEKPGGDMHSVHKYGIYGDIGKRLFYHEECLKAVNLNPEFYGHLMVDKALYIHELQEKNYKDYTRHAVKKFRDKIEKCHANVFKRMLPKGSRK